MNKFSPIFPTNSISNSAFGAVIFTMCFIACLVLGVTLTVNSATKNWLKQAHGAMTVQVIETPTQTSKAQLSSVLSLLRDTKGIIKATPLSENKLLDLLEPWLGDSHAVKQLPLPILIDIMVDTTQAINVNKLRSQLKSIAPYTTLDTHGNWREDLIKMSKRLYFLTGIIFILVMSTIMTVMVFALRANLANNTNIVDILYLIGASHKFVVKQLERYFLRIVLYASAAGYIIALITYGFTIYNLPNMPHILFSFYLLSVPIVCILLISIVLRILIISHLRTNHK